MAAGTRGERLSALLQIDYGANEDEIRALETLFSEVGTDADVHPRVMQFSQTAPWILIISVAWTPFVKKLQELVTEDASEALKEFVGRAREARRLSGRPDGKAEVKDVDSRVTIAGLSPDMAGEAYLALGRLDIHGLPFGSVARWSNERGEWIYRSPGQDDERLEAVPLRGRRLSREEGGR
jgi:hypothetical protein